MALTQSPLFSLDAKGQLAQTAIFQEYQHKTYIRAYGEPNWDEHPPTEPQLAVQAQTKSLMEHWEEITAADKATWDALAIPKRVSRINSYLQENYRRLRTGRLATDFWPAIEPSPLMRVTEKCNPNNSGYYPQIENINDHPAWQKTASFYIFFFPDISRYVIALSTTPTNYWMKTTQVTQAEGAYEHVGTYTGHPQVTPQ